MSSTALQRANEWVSDQITACRPRTRFWLTRGGLSVLDEGMIAGSNFLIGVLLARWLVPDQYGAYALSYSIFLVLVVSYNALILEPIAVFGPTFHLDSRQKYLGTLVRIQIVAVLLVMAVLGLSSYFAGHVLATPSVASALEGLTLAAPFLLIFSFTRFAFYLDFKPGGALSGSVFYCVLATGGLMFLYGQGLLSPFTAFLLLGVAALVSSTIQLVRLKPALQWKFFDETLVEVWQKHWSYGRWSLPTSILSWLPANLFYFLAGSFWGLSQTGALKALTNFVVPLGHLTVALSLLLTPYVSMKFGQQGSLGANLPVQRINTLFFLGGISYCVLISVFRNPIFHALYGHRYHEFIYLIPLAGIVAALNMAGSGSRIGLRAIQSPSSIFVSYSAASAACVVFGIPLVWIYGVSGALVASMISGLIMFSSSVWLFRKKVSIPPVIAT